MFLRAPLWLSTGLIVKYVLGLAGVAQGNASQPTVMC